MGRNILTNHFAMSLRAGSQTNLNNSSPTLPHSGPTQLIKLHFISSQTSTSPRKRETRVIKKYSPKLYCVWVFALYLRMGFRPIVKLSFLAFSPKDRIIGGFSEVLVGFLREEDLQEGKTGGRKSIIRIPILWFFVLFAGPTDTWRPAID